MSDELVNSAVTFLQDPKVADAPLAKRIAFLESKGLSSEQVQVALQRAQDASAIPQNASSSSSSPSYAAPARPAASYAAYNTRQDLAPPPLPQRDWRDWFIMAVVSGGFSWAAYFLAKRYIIPLLSPPTPTQLEEDKESVTAQFDQVQEMLSILQKDTEEIKAHSERQNKKVEDALETVDSAVQDMKSKTERRENDIRRLGLEMLQLRELIPKAIDQVKSAQNDALTDLNGELRSLKTLLQNRLKATGPSIPSSSSTSSANTGNAPPAAASTKSTPGPAGGSVGQVAQAAAASPGLVAKSTVPDPLARFTNRGNSAGIPDWQKSAPAVSNKESSGPSTDGSSTIAGSVKATAANAENSNST